MQSRNQHRIHCPFSRADEDRCTGELSEGVRGFDRLAKCNGPAMATVRTSGPTGAAIRRSEDSRMSHNIEGKVVVITGASSGLGAAAARHLSSLGATVVLGARRVERIQALANELVGSAGRALAIATDVTQFQQVQRLVDAAVETYGRIDVIINNAGLMPQSPLDRRKIDDWNRTIDVNIKGVLYGIAAALPYMQKQKSGHIINVSSVAGHKVRAGGVVYAATKHAVRVISEGLREEVKPYDIRTTVISPGAVDTELTDSITEPDVAENLKRFYAQVAVPADSFARAVAFAIGEPAEVDINEILYRPTRQEY
jgi:NADP-dependent 3-hydroxy acid dehydrogenase YdfG